MMEEEQRKALTKYADQQINEQLLTLYKKAQEDILTQVSKVFEKVAIEGSWTWVDMQKYNRAEKLYQGIQKITKDLGGDEERALKNILKATYQEEYARKLIDNYYELLGKSVDELQQAFDLEDYERSYYGLLTKDPPKELLGFQFHLIDTKAVEEVLLFPWSGANYSDRIWKEKGHLMLAIKEDLTQSMIQGESMYKAAARVKKRMGSTAFNCTRLARTEIMRASNEGHIKAIQEDGIEKVQWLATLDERTCDICGPKDMKIYSLNERPTMPAHPQCRCCWIPVISDVTSSGKRLVQDTGKVITETPWDEWKVAKYTGIIKKQGEIQKFGKVIPPFKTKILRTTRHGDDRLNERGVTLNEAQSYVDEAVIAFEQRQGTYLFLSDKGVSVVNKKNKLVTVYPAKNYDETTRITVKAVKSVGPSGGDRG